MSADSHMDLIYVPPDIFGARMPERWGERTPHVVERDGRRVWVSGEDVLGPYGVYGPDVTGGRRGRILAEAGFASGRETRPSDLLRRQEDQARDGVEAEVMSERTKRRGRAVPASRKGRLGVRMLRRDGGDGRPASRETVRPYDLGIDR
jgi:hypothetical protein